MHLAAHVPAMAATTNDISLCGGDYTDPSVRQKRYASGNTEIQCAGDDLSSDQEMTMAPEKKSRREMVQMAGAGVLALGTLQGGSAPRKQLFKDPTGTSDALAVVRSGHLLFVSGVGGYYPSRRSGNPGDIKQQTADALDLMKALLQAAGATMADLLQVQVALVDSPKNWEPMNEVYDQRVPEPRPVRSYFGTTGFRTPGQLLQMDAIAYVD
jgi:enamine deaminase RidA (YjgF/YER057c/UK114 family)